MTGNSSAPPRAVEIILNPGIGRLGNALQTIGQKHFLTCKHSHPVTGGIQGIQIMGDKKYGQAEGVSQGDNQIIEGGGAKRRLQTPRQRYPPSLCWRTGCHG